MSNRSLWLSVFVQELRMTMEEVVCHPWLLGEIAPAEEASAPGREYSEQQPTKSNTLSRGGSGGVCLRHNSLRLVVPGSEDFLTELDEAAISDAGNGSFIRTCTIALGVGAALMWMCRLSCGCEPAAGREAR